MKIYIDARKTVKEIDEEIGAYSQDMNDGLLLARKIIMDQAAENVIAPPCKVGDTVYWISDDRVRAKQGGERFQIESFKIKGIRAEIWGKQTITNDGKITEAGMIEFLVSDGCGWSEFGGDYAIPDAERAAAELERMKGAVH